MYVFIVPCKVMEHTSVEHVVPVNDKITVFGYRAAVAVIDKDSTRAQIFLIKSALDVIVVICRLDHGIADLCTVYLNKPVSVVILFPELVQISKLALKFGTSGICSVISRCFPVMVSAGIVYLTDIDNMGFMKAPSAAPCPAFSKPLEISP